jgi:hypothetical protein
MASVREVSIVNEFESQSVCSMVEQSLRHGGASFRAIPGLLKRIIQEKAWLRRKVENGKIVELSCLRDLVTKEPFEGWGEDVAKVEAIIKDNAEVLAMWREAMVGNVGNPTGTNQHQSKGGISNNITNSSSKEDPKPERGTSKSYTLSRLKRERKDLFESVCKGELTANKAAIQAGFRKVRTALEAGLAAWKRMTPEEKEEFRGRIWSETETETKTETQE